MRYDVTGCLVLPGTMPHYTLITIMSFLWKSGKFSHAENTHIFFRLLQLLALLNLYDIFTTKSNFLPKFSSYNARTDSWVPLQQF